MKNVEERPGPAHTSVFAILKNNDLKGKIVVAYPRDGAGTVYVGLWDFTDHNKDVQQSAAGGYGYDKTAAAMRGLTFDGIELKDHPTQWEKQIEEAGYSVYRLL